jgi:acyl dehydratase
MPRALATEQDIQQAISTRLGVSAWQTITFDRIQAFADVTGDHQWIHVDRERVAAESPFGAPIAHGYLTLALVAPMFFEIVDLPGWKLVVNYGCNRVRYPHPVVENSKVRLTIDLSDAGRKGDWWELTFLATMEIEGATKPGLVAEVVYRLLPPDA